jgi:hypothetical protein
MKQAFKMTTLLLLVLLYGFIPGVYSSGNSLPVSDVEQNCSDSPLNKRSFFTASILFNAFLSENQVNGTGLVPAPLLKERANDYTAHPRLTALLHFNLFSCYLIYSRTIDPGFPKTIIAFPFHYFW